MEPLYRSKTEKLYWKHGIPKEAWRTQKLGDLNFVKYKYAGFEFPPSVQKQALRQVWKAPRQQIICIANKPGSKRGKEEGYSSSVEPAILAGMFALRRTIDEHRRAVQIIQAGLENDAIKSPKVVLIHNVLGDATRERIQEVRDLLFRYKYCPRILVVSVCDHPEDFCRNRLGIYPTSCCLLG